MIKLGHLRPHARESRLARRPTPVWWGVAAAAGRRRLRRRRRPLRARRARPQAPARLLQHRERRHHPHRARAPRWSSARSGSAALAVLALVAALYHTVNHAAFKALLFLGAGAVVHATGTRNMEALGGLIKRMPWTAACFLVGAARHRRAAAAQRLRERVADLPGAAAERPDARGRSSTSRSRSGWPALALTSGLAVACFVKAVRHHVPRAAAQRRRGRAPRGAGLDARRRWSLLAVACVVLGLGPTLVLPALARPGRPAGRRGRSRRSATGSPCGSPVSSPRLSTGRRGAGPRRGAARPAGRAPALPARRAGRRSVRDVGLRPDAPDRAHGVHRDGLLESLQAGLRLPLPARASGSTSSSIPSRASSCERIAYANPTAPARRGLALPAGPGRALRASRPRAPALQSGSANLYLAYILAALLLLLVLA